MIETLSSLPIDTLNDIRFAAAVAINANPSAIFSNNRLAKLIEACNLALELKDAQRLSGMDTIDIDCQFV